MPCNSFLSHKTSILLFSRRALELYIRSIRIPIVSYPSCYQYRTGLPGRQTTARCASRVYKLGLIVFYATRRKLCVGLCGYVMSVTYGIAIASTQSL